MHDTIDLEPITKNTRFILREDARAKPQPWRWPLPRLGNRDPIVLSEHEYAVQSGEVSHALETPSGFEIALDHGGRTWGTLYAHLSKMFVTRCLPRLRRRQSVQAGDVIG